MHARLRMTAPLVGLLALLALLLMPHQAGTHSERPSAGHGVPGAAADVVRAVVDATVPEAMAVIAAAVADPAGSPAGPVGDQGPLLAVGCAVMMLALVLLSRPTAGRTVAGPRDLPVRRRARAPRAAGTGPPRDLLTEICVSRT